MMRHEMIRPRSLFETLVKEDLLSNQQFGEGIDIYKVDDSYHIDLDMPGFSKEDISVEFNDNVLSIKAERKTSETDESPNYYYKSRRVDNVTKSIRFADVDGEKVDARYENGVLKVVLPKLAKVDTINRINVK